MRLVPDTSVLCVVDLQEKLLPAIPTGSDVVTRTCRLVDAARLFGVPVLATEQYPRGLGPTVEPLAGKLERPTAKMSFSCCGSAAFTRQLGEAAEAVVLCGLETHVCIAQTALDLLAEGFGVWVAVDAVASRCSLDHDIALRRLEAAGALLTTVEAIMFEWCRSADHAAFRTMRGLLDERSVETAIFGNPVRQNEG